MPVTTKTTKSNNKSHSEKKGRRGAFNRWESDSQLSENDQILWFRDACDYGRTLINMTDKYREWYHMAGDGSGAFIREYLTPQSRSKSRRDDEPSGDLIRLTNVKLTTTTKPTNTKPTTIIPLNLTKLTLDRLSPVTTPASSPRSSPCQKPVVV